MVFAILFTLHCSLFTSPARAKIGTWRNYLAYYDIQQIQEAGNDIFVLASNGLYQYNKQDQSIRTYDKTNGLSDTYITHIRWCQQAKRLIAVYQNSNIDIIDNNGNIINISSLYNKSIIGDKTVNSIRIDGVYAYLMCGFGIVKVDMKQALIAYTYTPTTPDYPVDIPDEKNDGYEKYIELVKTLKPGGPKYNAFGYLHNYKDKLYSTNGIMGQKAHVQVMDQQREWEIYQNDIEDIIGHHFLGLTSVDIDPRDDSHVLCSGQTGVYEFKNGKFIKEYTNDNSPLKTAQTVGHNNKEYVIVVDGKFDSQGNYWCLNSVSPSTSLLKLTPDNQWVDYHNRKLMVPEGWSLDDMRDICFDIDGTLWFCNNWYRVPSVIRCVIDTKDITLFNSFVNQDGASLNINAVHCITFDKDRNIWVGTNTGLLVLERKNIDTGNINFFTQIKVPRNDGTDYADYLLNELDITAIAVDGANRKWVGTSYDGVYLISADNMTQIHHFTQDNSPLISNNIRSITINNKTGEVFFGSEIGLCSYVSNAVEPSTEMTEDNVWAYPNPVNPDYTGPITITGLTYNADVKIVSANGLLINEGRSNGGSFTWDGCDKKGNRVASGIYMVVTATSNGQKGTVCKIAIIR